MQQRQRVRERQPEREQRVQDYEWNESRDRDRTRWNQLYKERPRVVKFDAAPWEQSRSAYHKVFTGPDIEEGIDAFFTKRAPVFTAGRNRSRAKRTEGD